MISLPRSIAALALLCASSAYAQSDEPIVDLGGAQLQSDPWYTYRDYPRIVLSYGLTGRVVVAFDMTEKGRATNCQVVEPGWHRELDRAACRLLQRKARFVPATDDGVPIATKGRLSIDF